METAQTGLVVRQKPLGQQSIDHTGQGVAHFGAQRDTLSLLAHGQHKLVTGMQLLSDPHHIFHPVLSIRIASDKILPFGHMVPNIGHTRFQCRTLTTVLLVYKDVGKFRGGIKNVPKSRAAAVIHDHHCKAVFLQLSCKGDHLLLRLISRDQYNIHCNLSICPVTDLRLPF